MDQATNTDSSQPFDPAGAVATYRRVIARLEAETTGPGKEEFQAIAKRLRSS